MIVPPESIETLVILRIVDNSQESDYLNPGGMDLEVIDYKRPESGSYYDELPLWSAPFGRMLLDVVPLRRGMTILDVGAGTGFLSVELAQRCGADSRVVAVDLWTAANARLRDKLRYLGIENVTVLEADAAKVDLADASIDLLVSNLGVHNFENPSLVLANCFRMAKPGATLVLTTNLTGHMAEFYDEYRETLVELRLPAALAALDTHVERRGTVESICALVIGAGFEVLGVETDSFRIRFADGSALLRHHLIRMGFLADWKALIPQESVEEVFSRLEVRLNAAAARRGDLALTIPMACIRSRRCEAAP